MVGALAVSVSAAALPAQANSGLHPNTLLAAATPPSVSSEETNLRRGKLRESPLELFDVVCIGSRLSGVSLRSCAWPLGNLGEQNVNTDARSPSKEAPKLRV